jgi:hypothetical protein
MHLGFRHVATTALTEAWPARRQVLGAIAGAVFQVADDPSRRAKPLARRERERAKENYRPGETMPRAGWGIRPASGN